MTLFLPSLLQSKNAQIPENQAIVTLNTPYTPSSTQKGYTSNELDDSSDESSTTDSSEYSSDWDSVTDTNMTTHVRDMSIASTYLPRLHKKSNKKVDILSYSVRDMNQLPKYDDNTNNDLLYHNTLFYPYSNLQSLLFSHLHPYIAKDYKVINNNHSNDDDDDDYNDNNNNNNIIMNWNDTVSVNKIRELISKLLITASIDIGIKEENIYLMFNSPSPDDIIQQLRFGVLSILCDIHIDRFGRRYYYYNNQSTQTNNEPEAHFYNKSRLPTALFGIGDIGSLDEFVQETPVEFTPEYESLINNNHDNTSPFKDVDYNKLRNGNNTCNKISPRKKKSSKRKHYGSKSTCTAFKYKIMPKDNNMNHIHSKSNTNTSIAMKISISNMPMINENIAYNIPPKTVPINYKIEPKNDKKLIKKNKKKHAKSGKRLSSSTSTATSLPDTKHIKFANKVKSVKSPKKNGNKSKIKLKPTKKHKNGKNGKNVKLIPNNKIKNVNHNVNMLYNSHNNNNKMSSINDRKEKQKEKRIINNNIKNNKNNKNKKKKKKKLNKNNKNNQSCMNLDEFKSIPILDIIDNNVSDADNYELAHQITKYFDLQFNDTDTVTVVSDKDKQPALSYWIKNGYVRKNNNILINNNCKNVLIYRACSHVDPHKPIVTNNEWNKYVENISLKYEHKSVNYIGNLLDKRFGDGCHYARSTIKYPRYDIFCRFSNKYECSFKLPSGAYIIAWRR